MIRSREAYRRSLAWCAERLEREGLDLLIDPINPRSMPGYYLNDINAAAELIEDLA